MPEFIRQAKHISLSDEEREDIIDNLAAHPELGDEIVGTGDMRKLRVAAHGESRGYRVITFFSGVEMPVFLVTVYAKNQKGNIEEKEKHIMKTLSALLIDAYRRKRP